MDMFLLRRRDRPLVDWSFLGTKPSPLAFTRASGGTYVDANGRIQTAATNVPRFDHDPATRHPKGLLLEAQRTNLLEYSSDLANAAWSSKLGSMIYTKNGEGAPDGTNTFNKIKRTIDGPSYVGNSTTKATSSVACCFSFYAKKGAVGDFVAARMQGGYPNRLDAGFNLAIGSVLSSQAFGSGFSKTDIGIVPIGNGVYRCWLGSATSPPTDSIGSVLSPNVKGSDQIDTTDTSDNAEVFIWGCQFEIGVVRPSSYIPTAETAVTRGGDSLVLPQAAWFNPVEGTLALEGDETPELRDGQQHLLAEFFDPGLPSNNVKIVNSGYIAGRIIGQIYNGGVMQTQRNPNIAAGANFKTAFAFKTGRFVLATNGTLSAPGATGTLPAMTSPQLRLLGHTARLRRLRYWSRALSNNELQQVTQ